MNAQEQVAVIGAGVIGTAVAYALARDGRRVLLLDRDEPGVSGASFGNAGHIAMELQEPLPSPALLFNFWRELFSIGGPLHVPARHIPAFLPWSARFALAAFKRSANTRHLAPVVRPSVDVLEEMLREIGRSDLLRRNGHYEIWLNEKALDRALAQSRSMEHLGVSTAAAPADLLEAAKHAAHANTAAGLWFPGCAHVRDPLEVVRAFATAAMERGATILRRHVRALREHDGNIEIATDAEPLTVRTAVVCAGAWSAPLLTPFKLQVPLESARGYHVEFPGITPLVDAPILYSNENILVTPMASRLRATSFMEFAEPDAPADPRKPARLRAVLKTLGYTSEESAPGWVGPRPVLPDYLPAIGVVPNRPNLFYSFGHQHIGLTVAAVNAGLVSDLVAGRPPRHDVSAFDLRRFGGHTR